MVLHLQWAKELKAEGNRLGRAGLSQRVIEHVNEFDGTYKGAMILAGKMKAISQAANFDDYWSEKVSKGFHEELGAIKCCSRPEDTLGNILSDALIDAGVEDQL